MLASLFAFMLPSASASDSAANIPQKTSGTGIIAKVAMLAARSSAQYDDSQLIGVTVSVFVTSANPSKPELVELLQGDEVVAIATLAISEDVAEGLREYTFQNVQPGTYNVRVSKKGHLSYTKIALYVGSDPVRLLGVNLLAGDINNDGQIDGKDLMLLSASIGKQGPDLDADLNGDEIVDSADLNLLVANYGKRDVLDYPLAVM